MHLNDIITIIAGGESAKNVDFTKLKGTIIGVNDSAIHTKCDIVVSMDRLWTENRWQWLLEHKPRACIRSAALKRCKERWGRLTVFECNHKSTEMADEENVINGTNSGLCAVNVAYQMRPAELFLVGFDMGTTSAHWYDEYDWRPKGTPASKYAGWKKEFGPAKMAFDKIDCRVRNLNPRHTIPQFITEWEQWKL